jgi:N-methylhydantoinase A
MSELFHCEHERVYAFRDTETPVEMTTVRLRVTGRMPQIRLPELGEDSAADPLDQRRICYQANYITAPVFRRRELARSQIVPGPAIIEQEDSTTWILPGWVGVVDRMGNLIISQVL